MWRAASLLVAISAAISAAAQSPRAPADVADLIDSLPGLAPEFAADLSLRLVERGLVADRTRAEELLDSSFERAGLAQEPIPLRALPGSAVDTDVGYRARAFAARLDTFSLRLRSIDALGRRRPDRALDRLRQLPIPAASSASCEAALVVDLGLYAQVAQRAANEWLSGERIDERRRDFLRDLGLRASTPIAALALLDVVARSELSVESRSDVLSILSMQVSAMREYPREMALTLHPRVGLSELRLAVSLSQI